MWFLLVMGTLTLGTIALFVFPQGEYKYFGVIPLVILLGLGLVGWVQPDLNSQTMTEGQNLAQAVLQNKGLEAKLEGNVIKISSSKFDVVNMLDMDLLRKIQYQADYVDYYNNSVLGNSWLEFFHPKTEKPLLKIEIVKTP